MMDAVASFERAGVPCLVKPSWSEGAHFTQPHVRFVCKGPVRKIGVSGGTYEPEGDALIVMSEETGLDLRMSGDKKPFAERLGPGEQLSAALEEGLKRALASYHL